MERTPEIMAKLEAAEYALERRAARINCDKSYYDDDFDPEASASDIDLTLI